MGGGGISLVITASDQFLHQCRRQKPGFRATMYFREHSSSLTGPALDLIRVGISLSLGEIEVA